MSHKDEYPEWAFNPRERDWAIGPPVKRTDMQTRKRNPKKRR